jgi:DNA-binding HxlR family transcriptional regulator
LCPQTLILRTLGEDGLVKRKTYPEIPPRVEYSLTEAGQSLIPHIQGLVDWVLQHKIENKGIPRQAWNDGEPSH